MAKKKTEETQSIDLTPLMTPVAVLMGAIMISFSIFFGIRGADFTSVENDRSTTANNASTNSVSSVSSSTGSVAGETAANLPVDIVEVDFTNAPIKGSNDADVMLVEFTDFECPFCSRHFLQTQGQIETAYLDDGTLSYATLDYPLSFHPLAQKAAEASHCARDQDKYWEMHDMMFNNQENITVTDLKGYAEDLGLNASQFDNCLDSGEHETLVQNNLALGSSAGVSGTPGFIIGEKTGDGTMRGFLIPGAYPFSTFQTIVDNIAAEGLDAAAEKCTKDLEGNLFCTS